jgi:hypothetical protein
LEPGALRQAGARIGKFEFENGGAQHMNNDFPVFRYSDFLLMKAEILLRQNKDLGDALMAVNMVRERAGVPAWGSGDLTLDNLLAERGREMFYEGWRRQDLIRFGKYGDEWWEKGESEPCKELMPIPAQVLAANPNLEQNPCY